MTNEKLEITISTKSIVRIITAGFIIYLLLKLSGVLMIILLSLMLSAALYPMVAFLNKRLPISISSVIVILILFLPIIFVIASVLPSLLDQIPNLLRSLDLILKTSSFLPESFKKINWDQYIQPTGTYLFNSTSVFTRFIGTFLTVVFLSLYTLIDNKRLSRLVLDLMPDSQERKVEKFISRLIAINGHYIRGNLLISLICGMTVWIGLTLLNIPFASSLGIFAGILDLLPMVGAILAITPAAIIGFTMSKTVGIVVILIFIIYQQFENHIIAPIVYNRALDLSPALTLIAVIIGTALFGIGGAFIALPIAASIPTIAKFVNEERRKK